MSGNDPAFDEEYLDQFEGLVVDDEEYEDEAVGGLLEAFEEGGIDGLSRAMSQVVGDSEEYEPTGRLARPTPPWRYLGVPEGFTARADREAPRRPDAAARMWEGRDPISITAHDIRGIEHLPPPERIRATKQEIERRQSERREAFEEEGVLRSFQRPRYDEDSPREVFVSLDSASRSQLQRDLAAAGLVTQYREGVLDNQTRNALSDVMSWANLEGTTWQQAIIDVGRAQIRHADEEEDELQPFRRPSFTPPDYASLAQQVKRQFRQAVGREPTDTELAGLADELSGFHREAFETQVDHARAEHELEQQRMLGEDPAAPDELDPVPDPAARFQQHFEEKFAGHIATEEERQFSQQAFGNLMQSLNLGRQVMGG